MLNSSYTDGFINQCEKRGYDASGLVKEAARLDFLKKLVNRLYAVPGKQGPRIAGDIREAVGNVGYHSPEWLASAGSRISALGSGRAASRGGVPMEGISGRGFYRDIQEGRKLLKTEAATQLATRKAQQLKADGAAAVNRF